jgi:DNA-binding CsgD family transcriptional regulator
MPASMPPLTARERQVASLLAAGLRPGEIADELYLNINTIKSHMRNLYAKAGARDRTALAIRFHTDPEFRREVERGADAPHELDHVERTA